MVPSRIAALAGLLLIGSVAAQATWYTSEAAFVAAINPSFYLEDFNNFTYGNPLNGLAGSETWVAPGANGFGWTASAAARLFSTDGAISTSDAQDPLILTFTGNAVSAFGGMVSNTDLSGAIIPGTVTITLSDNTTQAITFAGAQQGFLGWAGPQTITGVSMVSSGALQNWVQLDHAYTGTTTVPEPATVLGLTIGALALLRRRKRA